MDNNKIDYIVKIYTAYKALNEVCCHRLCPPGIKGLQEELLDLCEIPYEKMMKIVNPNWPEYKENL